MEVEDDNVGCGKKLRVKVLLDLTKPLARGRTINITGEKFWIPLCYEKLPRICFSCGCIVHAGGTCRGSSNPVGGDKQFGVWLRAPAEGRNFRSNDYLHRTPPSTSDNVKARL